MATTGRLPCSQLHSVGCLANGILENLPFPQLTGFSEATTVLPVQTIPEEQVGPLALVVGTIIQSSNLKNIKLNSAGHSLPNTAPSPSALCREVLRVLPQMKSGSPCTVPDCAGNPKEGRSIPSISPPATSKNCNPHVHVDPPAPTIVLTKTEPLPVKMANGSSNGPMHTSNHEVSTTPNATETPSAPPGSTHQPEAALKPNRRKKAAQLDGPQEVSAKAPAKDEGMDPLKAFLKKVRQGTVSKADFCEIQVSLEAQLPSIEASILMELMKSLQSIVVDCQQSLQQCKNTAQPDSPKRPDKKPRKEVPDVGRPWDTANLEIALASAMLIVSTMCCEKAPRAIVVEEVLESVIQLCHTIVGQLVTHCKTAEGKKEAKGAARKTVTELLGGLRAVLMELLKALRCHLLGDLSGALLAVVLRCLALADLPGQDTYLVHPAIDLLRALFSIPQHRRDIIAELMAKTRIGELRQRVPLLHGKDSITAGTAVFLHCIQACAPTLGTMPRESAAWTSCDRAWREAQRTTEFITAAFLDSLFGSQASVDKEDREVAHRQLQLLFDDLIVCLSRPEWPAAEPLLRQLLRVLERECLGTQPVEREKAIQDRLRAHTVDLMGKMALHAKKEAVAAAAASNDHEVVAIPADGQWYVPAPPEPAASKPEIKGGRKKKAKVDEPPKDPPEGKTIPMPEYSNEERPDNPVQYLPQREALRCRIFEYLTSQARTDEHHALMVARQLMVCRWATQDMEIYEGRLSKLEAQGKVKDPQRHVWQQEMEHKQKWFLNIMAKRNGPLLPMSSEEASAAEYQRTREATRYLMTTRQGSLLNRTRYMYTVKLLLRVFVDDTMMTSTKDRSKSVKALARLVEEDPELLGAVLHHIKEGLASTAIAVREAVLELLGTILVRLHIYEEYLKAKPRPGRGPPNFAYMRIQMVHLTMDMLNDKGASVMNRAVRILGSVLKQRLLQHNQEEETACCYSLVKGGVDKDGPLRKHVLRLFREMWFNMADDGEDGADSDDHADLTDGKLDPLTIIQHITDVFSSTLEGPLLEFAEDHPMVRLLQQLLAPDVADRKVAIDADKVQKRISELVNALVQHLVPLSDSPEATGHQSQACCLATLHMFAIVKAEALADRLLHPTAEFLHVNRQSSSAPALLYHAMGLLAYVTRHSTALQEVEIEAIKSNVIQEVTKVIKTYSVSPADHISEHEAKLSTRKVTEMAVRCLCHLCHLPSTQGHYAPDVFAVFHHVYVYLQRFLDHKEQFEKWKLYMLRYLLLLACFLRGFAWDQHSDFLVSWLSQSGTGALGHGNELCRDPLGASYHLLIQFRDFAAVAPCDEDLRAQMRSMVLTALGSICICNAKGYLQRVMPDIENGLRDSAMQYHALTALHDFLRHDEKRIKEAAVKQVSGQEVKQLDTGLSFFGAQRPLGLVLDCLLSPSQDVRTRALEVVDICVRHGLVLPALCIEGVITVLQDPALAIPAAALLQFFEEHARNVLRNVAGTGVVRSYLFAVCSCGRSASDVRGATTAAPGDSLVSIHQPLYAVLQRHKDERNAFLDQVVRQMVKPFTLPKRISENVKQVVVVEPRHLLAFVRFLAESLAYLGYLKEDEVLHLITRIDVEINLLAEGCRSTLESLLETATLEPDTLPEQLVVPVALTALLTVKKFLMAEYRIAHAKVEKYRNGLIKQAFETRRHEKGTLELDKLFKPLTAPGPLGHSHLQTVYQNFKQQLEEDDQAYWRHDEEEADGDVLPASKPKSQPVVAKPRAKPAARGARRKNASSSEDEESESSDSSGNSSSDSSSEESDSDLSSASESSDEPPPAKPAAPKKVAPKPPPKRRPPPKKTKRPQADDDAEVVEDESDEYVPGKKQRKR